MSGARQLDLRLYVIVDAGQSARTSLPELAWAAARGGATLIQYRDKEAGTAEMVAHAKAIRTALAGSGVPLLVNDRADVARAAQTDGVHLGQDDMAPGDARRVLGGDAIIGRSITADAHAR